VGLRAGLDTEVEEKSLVSAGDRTSIARSSSPYPDAILTELPRLLVSTSTEIILKRYCMTHMVLFSLLG
jgi:hypothetical protein